MLKRTVVALLSLIIMLFYGTMTLLDLPDSNGMSSTPQTLPVPGERLSSMPEKSNNMSWYIKTKVPLKLRLLQTRNPRHYFRVCDNLKRPTKGDIKWHKNFYHHMDYVKGPHGIRRLYMAKFFFDNRYATRTGYSYLRTFAVVEGPYKNISDNATMAILYHFQRSMLVHLFYASLWYDGYEEPVQSVCWTQEAHALSRSIDGHFYLDYVITCPLPDLPFLPTHASLACCPCTKSGVFLPITYPVKTKDPGKFDIALCMSALYGTVNDSFVPYFVNWMEILKLFGVSEVITNNATIYAKGKLISNAFQYYQQTKFLNLQNYPIVHAQKIQNMTNETERAIANSVSKTASSECFLTNMHRFWYILYHDIDELVIPQKHLTYAEYFKYLFSGSPGQVTKHCLAVRSAFSYSFFPVGNPEYPEHLPLLRRTRRWTEEPLTVPEQGFLGMAKSFSHVHYLVAVGNHICRETHEQFKFIDGDFLPPEDMLVVHYRDKCEFRDRCEREGNYSIHDPLIVQKWGSQLQERVEIVLNKIGYFDTKLKP